jgi:hypothetical protein
MAGLSLHQLHLFLIQPVRLRARERGNFVLCRYVLGSGEDIADPGTYNLLQWSRDLMNGEISIFLFLVQIHSKE